MLRLVVDPKALDAAVVRKAADAIRAGQVVAIPTDTLYGLAVDPFQPDAVRRIFSIGLGTVSRVYSLMIRKIS